MVAVAINIEDWSVVRDREGHRDYRSKWLIQCSSSFDGPAQVLTAAGLPAIGSPWIYGNDTDLWALCWPNAQCRPVNTKDKNYFWTAELLHTTRPIFRCQDTAVEDPLLEPPMVGGSFVNYLRAVEEDRNGDAILSSSHEQIVGLEKDDHRATVKIGQNIATNPLAQYSEMMNTLNDAVLWGMPPRHIKLSNVSWTRKYYGTCSIYYTRQLEFDVRFNSFDLDDVPDMGFKHFRGRWASTEENGPARWVYDELFYASPTERANPENYVIIKDKDDENTPTRVMLDGAGKRNLDPVNYPAFLPPIELYDESNFLLLGIPTIL